MSNKSYPVLVIGVGASAGGLDALKRFFQTVPKDASVAFIVVQHLDPNHESMMAGILERQTPFSFCQAKNNQKICAGKGYIIPPDAYIEVIDHTIQIVKPIHQRGSRLAIDHLFRSMAVMYKSKAVGLLFSGSGSDGTAGLRALKAAGGLCIVQNPKQAEYPSMPRSAIDAGVVDQALDVEDIYELLIKYSKHPYHTLEESNDESSDESKEQQNGQDTLRTISSLLRAQENFDLDQYKSSTVERRLYRRMSLTAKSNEQEYIQYLRENDDERKFLMRDLLINVTDFFRDKDAFELLNSKVIHNIVKEAEEGTDIRVWIAGCASGEEAYTVAILLTEAITVSTKDLGIKIFATDVDEDAIRVARRGTYPHSVICELPKEYLNEYFTLQDDGNYVVNGSLRDCISFAHQNVYTDPPFSRLHLVCCRNLLIYLRTPVQQKVLNSFYFSLLPSGFLFLGSSENLGEQKKLFTAISSKWRIFSRNEKAGTLQQASALPSFFKRSYNPLGNRARQNDSSRSTDRTQLTLLAALDPSIVIDENNKVIYLHGALSNYLNLPIGSPELNFFDMLDNELRTRIRSGLFKARKTGEQVTVNPPRNYQPKDTSKKSFKTKISPVKEGENPILTVIITFEVMPLQKSLPAQILDLTESKDQDSMIDAMEKELGETKEELQNLTEELETSTEELKAAHEEALSTNEELQSSNEELEASTEELRSLNEELTTVNAQLKDKIDELSTTSDDIKNFLASTNLATIFLSNELKIKRFTPAAERLLRIRAHDIDSSLDEVSLNIIDDATLEEARRVLSSLESSEKEIESNGRWFIQKILPYQTQERRVDGVVLVYSEITRLKLAVERLEASGKQHEVIATLGIKALSTGNMDNLTDQLVREVAYTLQSNFSKVLEYYPQNDHLLLKAGVGWDKGLVGSATVQDDISSQAGFTLQSKTPVIVKDLASEQRFKGPTLLTDHKIVSGMSCTIENGGHPYGILAVHSSTSRIYTQDDANFLVSAANILSVALHRASIEQQLRESENRLRIAKNSNNVGSFEYSIKTGEVSWDQLLNDVWGTETDHLTLNDFERGVHPDDIDRVNEAMMSSQNPAGDGHYMATYRVIHAKTKRVSWIEATGQVLYKDGHPDKMIGMVIDITEKMILETSLKAAVKKLQEANDKKNEFLATLGHEIRNPLAAIASGVQILEEDKKQLPRATSMIKSNVSIVSSLLDDLLDLTRIARGQIKLKKQNVNFSKLLSEVYHSFVPQCERKKQKLSLIAPNNDIVLFIDGTRIQQALTNVISNAHKFTPEDGTIAITLKVDSDQLQVEIRDSGVGIDMQFKEKVLEPFQQLEQNNNVVNSGLGIGLALVKQFMILHDGSISVSSEGKNTGTLVNLTLPNTNNDLSNSTDVSMKHNTYSVSSEQVSIDSLNILIVDDNEDAAYGLSLLLESKGCTVYTFHTARAALKEFKNLNLNVYILDISLPDISGFDLLTELKQNSDSNVLKIALTGFGHKDAKERSKDAGFNHHITKPLNFNYLIELLYQHATSLK